MFVDKKKYTKIYKYEDIFLNDTDDPLFSFYQEKNNTLFLGKILQNKIFSFDYFEDFTIQLTQVINLENIIHHICLLPVNYLDVETNEIAKFVYLFIFLIFVWNL